MNTDDFILSVEEIALVMSIIGQPQMAHDIMVAQLGAMQKEEAHIRLLTAGHSLLARKWLDIDAEGKMSLVEPLMSWGQILVHADFSIRYSRSSRQADYSFTHHFKENRVLTHIIEQGLLHHITQVSDRKTLLQEGKEFFEVGQTDFVDCPEIEIPQNVLNEIKDEKSKSNIVEKLKSINIPSHLQSVLVEDLSQVRYRGSILRVEYGEEKAPFSERGLLVLRGPSRLWLLRSLKRIEQNFLVLLPGSEPKFEEEIRKLL